MNIDICEEMISQFSCTTERAGVLVTLQSLHVLHSFLPSAKLFNIYDDSVTTYSLEFDIIFQSIISKIELM